MRHVFEQYDRESYPTKNPYKFCPLCKAELVLDPATRRQTCSACGFIHFRNPSPSVTVCIIKDDKVFLTKRAFPPGKALWAIPGGYIELEEDFLTAGVREMKEETGLDVRITAIINISSSFISPEWHLLNVCLLAEVLGGELAGCDEFESFYWHLLSDPLPEMAFPEDVENLFWITEPSFHGLPVKVER